MVELLAAMSLTLLLSLDALVMKSYGTGYLIYLVTIVLNTLSRSIENQSGNDYLYAEIMINMSTESPIINVLAVTYFPRMSSILKSRRK